MPISFVSEHIETLEEIDIEYREVAEAAGIKHWRRAPALNTDAAFIDELAAQVTGALAAPVVSSVEACVVNAFDLSDTPVGVLPGVDQPAEFLNARTASIALLITFVVELLANDQLWFGAFAI